MRSLSDAGLLAAQFDDPDTASIFSDSQFIRYALEIEAALATIEASLGVIPESAALAIVSGAASFKVDMTRLQREAVRDGVPIIDLVRQLREHIGGEAASYVHWGATTQDIMDTALVLQIRETLTLIEGYLNQLSDRLTKLADRHRTTLMAGRTHSQQALPIPFGLKVAGWLAPLLRHRQRLAEVRPRVLVVQFGGAVGTLASLGQRGEQVQKHLADALKLGIPTMPWHTQRDSLVELAGWLSLVTGSLAKMAQDIILMAQTEIGELTETHDHSRGGSSTMPQKSNPVISEMIIAAARTNAALLSALHQAQIQEHERGTHGWQVEWLNLPDMFILTAGALKKAIFLSENFAMDVARMRQNVEASHGLMMAEALSLALAPHIGRDEATRLVADACRVALDKNRHLVDVLHERAVQGKIDAVLDWERFKDESNYFGSSEVFIDRVLNNAS